MNGLARKKCSVSGMSASVRWFANDIVSFTLDRWVRPQGGNSQRYLSFEAVPYEIKFSSLRVLWTKAVGISFGC